MPATSWAACPILTFVASLLDDVSPDAKCLLNMLLDVWARADEWPHGQYVEHEMATAGLDLHDVLRDLPEWEYGYRAIRVLRASAPLPTAPAELAGVTAGRPVAPGQKADRPGSGQALAFSG
jgi:hypothetical protein